MKRLLLLCLMLVSAVGWGAETWTAQASDDMSEIEFVGSLSGAGDYTDFAAGDTITAAAQTVAFDQTAVTALKDLALTFTNTSGGFTYDLATNNVTQWTITPVGKICVICSHNSGTWTVDTIVGSTSGAFYGVRCNGTGTLRVNTVTGGDAISAYGVYNGSTGTVYVTTLTGGSAVAAHGCYNASTGSIYADYVVGGSAATAYGVYNISSGSIYADYVVGGSAVTAYGVFNGTSNSKVYINKIVYFTTTTGVPIAGYGGFYMVGGSKISILSASGATTTFTADSGSAGAVYKGLY